MNRAFFDRFCLVYTFHTHELPVIFSLYYKDLCVGALSYLLDDVEVIQRNHIHRARYLLSFIKRSQLEGQWKFKKPQRFSPKYPIGQIILLIMKYTIFIIINIIIFRHENIQIEISRIDTDQSTCNMIWLDFFRRYQRFKYRCPIDF